MGRPAAALRRGAAVASVGALYLLLAARDVWASRTPRTWGLVGTALCVIGCAFLYFCSRRGHRTAFDPLRVGRFSFGTKRVDVLNSVRTIERWLVETRMRELTKRVSRLESSARFLLESQNSKETLSSSNLLYLPSQSSLSFDHGLIQSCVESLRVLSFGWANSARKEETLLQALDKLSASLRAVLGFCEGDALCRGHAFLFPHTFPMFLFAVERQILADLRAFAPRSAPLPPALVESDRVVGRMCGAAPRLGALLARAVEANTFPPPTPSGGAPAGLSAFRNLIAPLDCRCAVTEKSLDDIAREMAAARKRRGARAAPKPALLSHGEFFGPVRLFVQSDGLLVVNLSRQIVARVAAGGFLFIAFDAGLDLYQFFSPPRTLLSVTDVSAEGAAQLAALAAAPTLPFVPLSDAAIRIQAVARGVLDRRRVFASLEKRRVVAQIVDEEAAFAERLVELEIHDESPVVKAFAGQLREVSEKLCAELRLKLDGEIDEMRPRTIILRPPLATEQTTVFFSSRAAGTGWQLDQQVGVCFFLLLPLFQKSIERFSSLLSSQRTVPDLLALPLFHVGSHRVLLRRLRAATAGGSTEAKMLDHVIVAFDQLISTLPGGTREFVSELSRLEGVPSDFFAPPQRLLLGPMPCAVSGAPWARAADAARASGVSDAERQLFALVIIGAIVFFRGEAAPRFLQSVSTQGLVQCSIVRERCLRITSGDAELLICAESVRGIHQLQGAIALSAARRR
eukprot:gnl/Chilomastix_cuspidata/3902.p1 GENE.gnl/Chilomastix_cuspidata/3902~~gnl/Chilomastix_cuspidata/3902.p1  ORF type:complete len:741 (-),score=359.12 gnl/Chilomastix_cuspidata/3902:12-2234(-)